MQHDIWRLADLGFDLTTDNVIRLEGQSFVLDCASRLVQSYNKLVFEGSKGTKLSLTGCEVGPSSVFDGIEDLDVQELPIFTLTHCITFRHLFLTSTAFMEIDFHDREELESWTNVAFDTSMIRVVLSSEETDKFLHFLDTYDVRGVLEIGDHVVVNRGIYTHHGVYVGHNLIIHYSGEPGVEGVVTEISLADFVKNDSFWVYEHDKRLSPGDIVRNARSRLHESEYSLLFNNCEHFAHWCCTGVAWSNQVFAGPILGNLANRGGAQAYRLR